MHPFAANRTGYHLHGSAGIVAPLAHGDPGHPAAPGREQRGVPSEQPFGAQRLGIALGRIEHHLDDAFDIAVAGNQSGNVHAEAAGNRGAHLLAIEMLALDLARLDHVFGQRLEDGLLAQREADGLHPPDQSPLPVTHRCQLGGKLRVAPPEVRPVIALVDVGHNLRTLCGVYSR